MLNETALKQGMAATLTAGAIEQLDTLRRAKALIGRRIILRRLLSDYVPGTPCLIMCVVDFGDGPLLWVTTDDARVDDVDQFTADELSDYFEFVADTTSESRHAI